METILKVNYYKIGLVLDLDCPKSYSVFDQVGLCMCEEKKKSYIRTCLARSRLRNRRISIRNSVARSLRGESDRSNVILSRYKFSAARLPFNESYFWLLVTSATEVPEANLTGLPLTIESEVTLALAGESSFYELYDVYNHAYRHGGKLNVTSMGYWDLEGGLRNYLTQYKYKRRQDFHGISLNFSIVVRLDF